MGYSITRNRRSVVSVTSVQLAALAACALAVAIAAAPRAARAQDDYKLNYFANNLAPPVVDQTVRIVNPMGSDRCANIYVFDARQKLQECCGCLITHNGLLTLSVHNQLTATPFSLPVPVTGVIKLLSSTPPTSGTCDPTTPAALLAPTLRAWATHNQSASPSPVVQKVTEEEFEDAPLDPQELGTLEDSCVAAKAHDNLCTCVIPTAPGP